MEAMENIVPDEIPEKPDVPTPSDKSDSQLESERNENPAIPIIV